MKPTPDYPRDVIPSWCRMPLPDHEDGLGGCWGISSGQQPAQGERYCVGCDFHKDRAEAAPVPLDAVKGEEERPT